MLWKNDRSQSCGCLACPVLPVAPSLHITVSTKAQRPYNQYQTMLMTNKPRHCVDPNLLGLHVDLEQLDVDFGVLPNHLLSRYGLGFGYFLPM
jgi:hypothetical protein